MLLFTFLLAAAALGCALYALARTRSVQLPPLEDTSAEADFTDDTTILFGLPPGPSFHPCDNLSELPVSPKLHGSYGVCLSRGMQHGRPCFRAPQSAHQCPWFDPRDSSPRRRP